jgi:nucleotide-binding universal stress UspA family protein
MYDRILVPTDGSEEGERAVRHAIGLAVAHDATIHAVYVVDSASYGGVPMETAWEGLHEMLEREGEAALDRVVELGDESGIPVETALLEGTPAKQIVRYAESDDCDLVVMGTHGRGGIDRLLLGSVAERVVRSSEVPVLTVQVSG